MQFLCLIGQLLGVFFEGGSRGRRDKVILLPFANGFNWNPGVCTFWRPIFYPHALARRSLSTV
jgi:hypothetical protein